MHYLVHTATTLKLHIIPISFCANKTLENSYIFTEIITEYFLNLIGALLKGQNTLDPILC